MSVARAALAQFTGSYATEKNVAKASALAREAAGNGAHIVCFPEICNTVYLPWEEDARHFAQAEPESGSSVTTMRAVARETGITIVYPFFERDGDHYFNAAVVIDPDGGIQGKYRKASVPHARLLPGASERFYFTPGDLPYRVFDTPFGFRFGIIICYERNLPEPARCVALAGADLLLVPVATTALVRPWWEVLLRAHAIQNVMYVGACNKVGPDEDGAPGTDYFGTSLMIDPRGDVVAQGSDTAEEIVYMDLDLDLLARQRAQWTFFEDRRPDLYGAITAAGSTPMRDKPAVGVAVGR